MSRQQCIHLILILYWLKIIYGQPAEFTNLKYDLRDGQESANKENVGFDGKGHEDHMELPDMNTNTLFNTNFDIRRDSDETFDLAKDTKSRGNHKNYNTERSNNKRVERYTFGSEDERSFAYGNDGNGKKRFPVYNFGLGKRARPYSFGLGKRSSIDDYDDALTANDLDFDMDSALKAAALLMAQEKRSRPYSFGLGKRLVTNLPANAPRRFNFGLGQ